MLLIGQFPHRGVSTTVCMIVVLLVCSSASQPPSNGRTFLGGGSYAVYPQWLITDEGLCEFTFVTSQLNGSLFYMDGAEGSEDFFYIQLIEGEIAVEIGIGRPQLSLRAHFGENINDNQPHNIMIIHSTKQFEFRLDGAVVATLNYSNASSADFRSQVHFGGVSDSLVGLASVLSEVSFAGCLQSIQFANGSTSPTMLFVREPVMETRVRNGCSDPCQSDLCNGGRCIQQWGTDVGYYCDCRRTLKGGPTCLEDPATYQLTPNTTSYFCYTLLPQPYINEPDTATALLVPPLPETGTILSSLSVDQNSSFRIYLRNHRIYVELKAVSTIYELCLQTVLSPDVEYQIQYLRQNTYVEIKLLSQLQLIESINMTLNISLQMDFRDICVGGGLLEVVNYYGIIESVFFRHFALAETQNFVRFVQTVIARSDVIQFTNASETPASLSFERYNLRSQHISFEFRMQPERSGVLLFSRNDRYEFVVVVFNGEILIISTDLSNSSQSLTQMCENTNVNDGLWHNLSIRRTGGGESIALGLRFTLDNVHVCEINDNKFELGLRSLITTSSLELGVTTDLYSGRTVPYIGCMQNIVFETGNEIFRPNLEVTSKLGERFETSGCFYCKSDSLSCLNGGRCSDRGASTDPVCACPAEYTGQQCQTLVVRSTTVPPQQSTPSTLLPTTTTTTPDNQSGGSISAAEIGKWVGIALAGVFGIILTVFIAVVVYLIYRDVIRKQGFYKTNESQGNKVSMLHYSASLRQLSSEAVTLETNGVVPVPGDKDKEFFL